MQSIMNDEFLRQIRQFADPALLTDNYSRLILTWCFEFYDQFDQAPKQAIQSIYEQKVQYVLRESDAKIIEELLANLSNEYINLTNIEYYVTQAELYFNKLSIKKLQDELGRYADRGMIDEAINSIGKFRRVERLESQGVDLLQNDRIIDEAFSEKLDMLFSLPGDLGHLLGSFNRGDLSATIGPQKRGKTWMLMEIATHAMQTGHKVWFISLEMTRNQITRRLWQQWTDSVTEEQEITIPYFDRNNDIKERYENRKPVDTNEMTVLRRKFRQHMKTSKFQVFYYPQNSFKVSTLRTLLENSFLYKNELPDIVVIDYASIMAPEKRADKRFELDQIWGDLASIATEFNIHICTATQANRATFKRDIEQGDSAEANAITAHVSLMFALNQTTENKSQHCMRIANMFARHKGFITDEQVVVLQNLACGKAMLDSRYEKKVGNLKRSKVED